MNLPRAELRSPSQDHLPRVRNQHGTGLKSGLEQAPLPDAVARERPNANRGWRWQWVFPAASNYLDRTTDIRHRHHLPLGGKLLDLEEVVRNHAVAAAARRRRFRVRLTATVLSRSA
jgi:hypothetical protein